MQQTGIPDLCCGHCGVPFESKLNTDASPESAKSCGPDPEEITHELLVKYHTRLILPLLDGLLHDISQMKTDITTLKGVNALLLKESAAAQRDNVGVRNALVATREEVSALRELNLSRYVGEHDDRLTEIDEELVEIKARLEKFSGAVQEDGGLEAAMGNMQIDGKSYDDETEWEDANAMLTDDAE